VSAPASDHERCVAAVIKLLTYRLPAVERQARLPDTPTDTDGRCRPLEAGARPTMHEDHVQLVRAEDAAFEEDDRSEHVTSTDN